MPYVAEEQICLNEVRDKVVPCDSPEARATLALPGVEVADDVAAKYGLGGSKAKTPAPPVPDDTDEDDAEDEPEVAAKAQAAPPANKAKNGAASK